MKYNPITRCLYTSDNHLIKKLSCSYHLDWNDLQSIDQKSKLCSICTKTVTDTVGLSEKEILRIIEVNPSACFKLDLNQNNILVVFDNPSEDENKG